MSKNQNTEYSLLERILALAATIIIIAAVLSFFVTLIVGMTGGRGALVDGLWPVVTWFGFWGLPIGLLLMISLLAIGYVRRGRESKKQSGKKQNGKR